LEKKARRERCAGYRTLQANERIGRLTPLAPAAERQYLQADEGILKYELWHSVSASSYMLLFEGDTASEHVKDPDSTVIWTCEAETYEEALQKRNDHLGWGVYRGSGIPFDYPPADRRR
jgi:hypothetical protein